MTLDEKKFVEYEELRIYPFSTQGEQSLMVQNDMKKWAHNEGYWLEKSYAYAIAAHAKYRGWMQPDFSGLEIVE